jgi:hypothetical protein
MIQIANTIDKYNKLILSELHSNNIKCWVAGGSLRDYFMGKAVKTDHDLFFPDDMNYNLCATYFKASGATVKWESDNGMKVLYDGKTIDLVKHFFSGPQECIDAFDFTVSMFACDGDKVYWGETSFMDLAKRQLMLNKIPYPASTLSRAFRYYKKGFTMCLEEMKKLCEAIQKMPIKEEDADNSVSDEQVSGDGFFNGID